MSRAYSGAWAWLILWLALSLISLTSRPLWPIDETRYVSVAWEMWTSGNWLVPHLNGEPYSDKPPLLFWLINLGWRVFGVSAEWPRVLSLLFALGGLLLTRHLAHKLWPCQPQLANGAAAILAGSLLWAVFTSAVIFDYATTFFTLAALASGLRVCPALRVDHHMDALACTWRNGLTGWLGFGLALGFGVLTKGPVMFLYAVPPMALMLLISAGPRPPVLRWISGLGLGVGLGGLIALAWALPAAQAGGEAYGRMILWDQTAGRVTHAFAHQHPWWWYLALAPVIGFPWLWWGGLWRGLKNLWHQGMDAGTKRVLAWISFELVAFSLISGKQPHYLLPVLPAFALAAARAIASLEPPTPTARWAMMPVAVVFMIVGVGFAFIRALTVYMDWPSWVATVSPGWGVAFVLVGLALLVPRRWPQIMHPITALSAASLAMIAVLNVSVIRRAAPMYDLSAISHWLGARQAEGDPIAHVGGGYQGQYQFLGRLKRPLETIRSAEVVPWARSHPHGWLIIYEKAAHHSSVSAISAVEPQSPSAAPAYRQPYRSHSLAVWPAAHFI